MQDSAIVQFPDLLCAAYAGTVTAMATTAAATRAATLAATPAGEPQVPMTWMGDGPFAKALSSGQQS